MKQRAAQPFFDQRIFWDIDVSKLEYDHKSSFIIERVFERGDVADIRNCRSFYGDEKVADVLLQAKYLSITTLYLASAVTGRSINEFRCYTPKQSNPQHLMY